MENRAARQVDFDGLVKIYVNDGAVLEDAVTEALESLTETGFHFDSVYVYRNDAEKELKDHIESRIATIEKAAAGTDSFVNANFAMQGILQCLEQKRSESIVEQVAILLHSRSAVRTALNLIPAVKDDDEEDAGKDNGEDDDSDEDEDEENALVTVSVLDFIIKIANVEFEIEAAMRLRLQMFLLEEADLGRIVSRLEEDVCEPRVVSKIVDFLAVLFRHESNKQLFSAAHGAAALALASRANKKNADIQSKIESLQTSL